MKKVANYFFILKDHKENFQNSPTVRLINPAKNGIGRISKDILTEQLKLSQWKNTKIVIE